MENVNVRVIKEPRGLIRIIQIVFAILGFATVVGFETLMSYKVECVGNQTQEYKVNLPVEYPFKFEGVELVSRRNCSIGSTHKQPIPMEFASSSQFFVTVGVLSMLYAGGSLAFYLLRSKNYETNPLLSMIDLIVTVILSIFWIAGAFAWVVCVSDIKHYTSLVEVKRYIPDCRLHKCTTMDSGDWASLNVAMIMGFGNAFLWCASIWFVYKETSLHHKQPMDMNDMDYPPSNTGMPQSNPFQPPQQQQRHQFSA